MNDTSSGNLSADSPIKELAADCLGYRPFAQNIATILDNATTREDCLVLGIHGEWGSGKTSAINLVVKELEWLQRCRPQYVRFKELNDCFLYKTFEPDRPFQIKETKPRTTIIHFSPWLFSNQENLTTAFFHELEKQLNNTWGNIKGFLKVIAALTLPSLEALSYLNPTTSKLVGNTTQHLIKNLQKRPSLEQAKQALNKALKAQKRPILIIIDDIDRLPADEMRQIFRMVKAVADLPYVTYLLGFDRKIVKRALEKDTDLEGPQWIEKIVQGSFDLPIVLQSRLTRYFDKQLEIKLPDLYVDLYAHPTVEIFSNSVLKSFVYPYLTTPRQVNRLINSLILQWMAVKDIVNPFDLVFIETCRLFKKKLYTLIKKEGRNIRLNNFEKIKTDLPDINIDLFREVFFNFSTDESMYLYLQDPMKKRLFSQTGFNNYFLYSQDPIYYPTQKLQTINSYLTTNNLKAIVTTIMQDLDKTLEDGSSKNLALINAWYEYTNYDNQNLKNILIILAATHNTLYSQKPTIIIRDTFIKIFNQIQLEEDKNDILIKIYQQYPFSNLLIHFIINCESVLVGSTMTNAISTYLFENQDIYNTIKEIYKEQITKLEEDKGLEAISSDLILLITASTEESSGQYSGIWINEKIQNNLENAFYIMQSLILTSKVISNQTEEEKEFNEIDEKIKKNINLSNLIDIAKKTLITNNDNDNDHNQQIAEKFLKAYNNEPNSFISE